MTQLDADTRSSLGKKRQLFLKNYLSAKVTGSARTKMIDFSIQKLRDQSINPKLLPAARINATTLISQLNERPLDAGRGQMPVASANAFKVLVSLFSGQDPKQNPDFVKIAAFRGIKNQLEMNLKSGQPVDPSAKAQLVKSAMEMLAAPADRDADAGAYWMKRQAVELAGLLEDPKTLPPLLAILNDETASDAIRLDVVKTFVKTGAMGTDPKTNGDVLASICKFAEKSISNEATHVQSQVDQLVRNGILYGDDDSRQKGMVFGTGSGNRNDESPAQGSGGRGGFGGEDVGGRGPFGGVGGGGRAGEVQPIVELPNYLLQISRDRVQAVAVLGGRAIEKIRPNLDAKAETLAKGTVSELGSLLRAANVGLIDLDRKMDPSEMEAEDQNRRSELRGSTDRGIQRVS